MTGSTLVTDVGVRLYLDLVKKVITNTIYGDSSYAKFNRPDKLDDPEQGIPEAGLGKQVWNFDPDARANGMDWPTLAHTMVGTKRMDNVHECLDRVLADDIPGDFIETGVWRGGVCIFMRAFLAAHEVTDRVVWLADSFQGLPEPTEQDGLPEGTGTLDLPQVNEEVLGVPMAVVRENFRRYGLLDDQVRFLPGWFRDTLPTAGVDRLALLRLDGDWYESTMDALVNLYEKVSPGGFVIIDDYMIPGCRQAVTDYRERHGITEQIEVVDETGVFWRKAR